MKKEEVKTEALESLGKQVETLGSSTCVLSVVKNNGYYNFNLSIGSFDMQVKPSFKLSKNQFRYLMSLLNKKAD